MPGDSTFQLFSETCVLGADAASLRVAPAAVTVDAGRIRAVEERHDAPAGARVLRRGLLSPAFVNAHTHLAMHGFRGVATAAANAGNLVEEVFFRLEVHLEPEDVRAFARVGALECALHGVGVVFDHYYHAQALAAGVRDVGLGAVIAPTLQDVAGPGAEQAEATLSATVALAGRSWVEAGIATAVGPHATDTVSAGLWRRALDVAGELGLPLHAHVAQSADEWRRCHERHGLSPLAWLEREGLLESAVPQLLVHMLFVDREDLARLRRDAHVLGFCPFSQMQFGYPAPVREWERAGLDFVVGTDCVPSNDSMNVQKELRALAGQSAYAVTHGPELEDLLAGATPEKVARVEERRRERARSSFTMADPAHLLSRVWSTPGSWHPQLPTGALEPGRRADLAIWDLDHPSLWPTEGAGASALRSLAFGDTAPALRALCVGGRWLGDPDDVRTLLRTDDARHILEEARDRRARLLRRAGLSG